LPAVGVPHPRTPRPLVSGKTAQQELRLSAESDVFTALFSTLAHVFAARFFCRDLAGALGKGPDIWGRGSGLLFDQPARCRPAEAGAPNVTACKPRQSEASQWLVWSMQEGKPSGATNFGPRRHFMHAGQRVWLGSTRKDRAKSLWNRPSQAVQKHQPKGREADLFTGVSM